MKQEIVITFRPGLIHRVRNFGEHLHHVFAGASEASFDLEQVDTATTELRVVARSTKVLRRVMRKLTAELVRHGFAGEAAVAAPKSEVGD